MSYENVSRRLQAGDVVILDGAMGTELQRRGAVMAEGAWSSLASVDDPALVRQIHRDYIDAGADVITANTFSASRERLAGAHLANRTRELNLAAVRAAQDAATEAAGARPIAIAGSISPVPDTENPMEPSLARARRAYQEQAEILAEAGVDLIMLEMLRDVEHAAAALESAASTGLPVWAGFSFTVGQGEEPVLLDEPDGAKLGELLEWLPTLNIAAVNVMHTEVAITLAALDVIGRHWQGPTGAYPHHGTFRRPNWVFEDTLSPNRLLHDAREWQMLGARIFGVCCGLGVAHVQALSEGLRGQRQVEAA